MSIGVAAIIPTKHETIAQFIVKADKALYRAKQDGKNRVRSNAIDAVGIK